MSFRPWGLENIVVDNRACGAVYYIWGSPSVCQSIGEEINGPHSVPFHGSHGTGSPLLLLSRSPHLSPGTDKTADGDQSRDRPDC